MPWRYNITFGGGVLSVPNYWVNMEIEFESDDSGDDISDGDAECLFCTGLFSHDKLGEKWAQCVRCYRWTHEDCGGEEDYLVCPMCRKSIKF